MKFHNLLKQHKYRLLYSSGKKRKPGPQGPSQKLIQAIVAIEQRNPRFGCPRIAQQINRAFGIDIDKDLVRRVLAANYRPGSGHSGPSWLSFLGHSKDRLWSIDLFRCESIHLKSHWVLVIMDHYTRRILGFGVHADDVALCRMFNTAISTRGAPHYLSSDNDPLFRYHRWRANLRILEIQKTESVPYVPFSHPFIERLIGTIRREFLDHALFWNTHDLDNKLANFQVYYNAHRTHSARDGDTPGGSTVQPPPTITDFAWRSHCGGLYQLPVAA